MLAALGLRIIDAAGRIVAPTPEGLAAAVGVDAHDLDARLAQSAITIMSDVNNPLCGERGATRIFGPQKGVDGADLETFDRTLGNFAALAQAAVGCDVARRPGAGAAGGLGFALQLLGGDFRSGAEVVAELIGLDAALATADWAITGEGRSDAQTLLRKAPFVVAELARHRGVPTTLLSGAIDAGALPELDRIFAGAFALPAGPASLQDCIADAAVLLSDRALQLARLWDAARARA
jgi:glycerate kinase